MFHGVLYSKFYGILYVLHMRNVLRHQSCSGQYISMLR